MLLAKKIVDMKANVLNLNKEIEIRNIWSDGEKLFFEDYITEKQYLLKKSTSKKYKYKIIGIV